MFDKMIKGALLFAAGAAVGAAGAMWLMSESGKELREELRDLATQAKDKVQECCKQIKEEVESVTKPAAEEPAAEA